MLKGGYPPIYPIEQNTSTTDNIKRNFSSNNIIDIKSIISTKKSSNLVNMLNLSESIESDNENLKKKNRNFKNQQLDNNFIDLINDLNNIKKINRPRKIKQK